jgi:hypothetical protein
LLWLLFNLLCWVLFLMTRIGRERVRRGAIISAVGLTAIISVSVVVTSVAPSTPLPHYLNPSRLLVGRIVAGLPRSVVYVNGDRQVGYVLDANAAEITMIESYPPRVWIVDAGAVDARVPCLHKTPWFQQSPLDWAASGWGKTRTTPFCNSVHETDAGHDPDARKP